MILKIIPLLIILHGSQCSMVVDSFGQKGIYVSDYCPHMKYCTEGAHVMCMYYDPEHVYGPRCSNPRNVTITPELANQLLDIINAIRSKIANGKETGQNNTKLPRGYGIFRLKWDNELATFAQVFANQCMLRHDFCRATKRFPEPGQTAGLVRFTYPGWDPISATTTTGLNDDKLSYSVAQILKSWYSQKTFVTEEMVRKYPQWELRPNLNGRLFLEIVHGSITHMGCGMSAYTEFIYYQNRPMDGRPGGQNYNSIEIICNFSSRPKPGQKAYLTSRPLKPYSKCGCPEGSEEDADCLCNEISGVRAVDTAKSIGLQTEPETCSNPENNCEPTLVLLPIFTVEDAPPEKLIERARNIEEPLASYVMDRLDNKSGVITRAKSVEIFNFFEETDREHQIAAPTVPHSLRSVLQTTEPDPLSLPKSPIMPLPLPSHHKSKHSYTRKQYLRPESDTESQAELEPESKYAPQPRYTPKRPPASKKSSIFTRVAKFKLPSGRKNYKPYESIKPDVKPRKDFKNVQRVVSDYIKRRNNKMGYRRYDVVKNKHKEAISKATLPTTTKVEEATEAILRNAEEKVINVNQYLKPKANVSTEENTKHYDLKYEESDNKLMTLLDTLEREVKDIELDGDEKEIFDAKIRKIYGSVVGKPPLMLTPAKIKPKPKSGPQTPLPHGADRESDFLESDFGESKAYLRHESNHVNPDDLRPRNDFLSEDDRVDSKNIKHFDYLDQKYKETFNGKYDKKNIDGKYADILDNKSINDNEMFDNDQKLFSDIERKYNERLARNYAMHKDRNYNDNENLDHKYRDNLAHKYDDNVHRKRLSALEPRKQNSLDKYENVRMRANSAEERKHMLDKYHDRDPGDRHYFRNGEVIRNAPTGDSKRAKGSHVPIEFDRDDPLSSERRKYYQDKLENLEKNLHTARSFRRRKDDDRGNDRMMRRMRPNLVDMDAPRSRSKSQGDSFYMPDRARFLHGF